MWKNRQFLKGLGTGLIAGAILLQLMLQVRSIDGQIKTPRDNTSDNTAGAGTDAAAVKELAPSLGLQVFEADEKLYVQAEVDAAVKQAVEEAKEQALASLPTPDPKQISVFVPAGMSASQVADYFYRSGVVADRTDFEAELSNGGWNDKIRTGLYTFPLNANVKDVIAKLTTPPQP